MPAMRVTLVVLLVAVLATPGCIENMRELKEALGVVAPAPEFEPPVAKAKVNATSTMVGMALRFLGDESRDPQGLALTYRWTFGDGETMVDAIATHAFVTPGEYRVVLAVTNSAGLTDEDTVLIQVRPANRMPIAVFDMRDAAGANITRTQIGQDVRFDATRAADPDGDTLTFAWDFGGGATSVERTTKFAFTQPGLHEVKLRVTDSVGATSTATRILAVDGTFPYAGNFDVATDATRKHTIPVGEGITRLALSVQFPSSLGGNDLTVVLKDAKGAEVAVLPEGTPAGAQEAQTRSVTLTSESLKAFAPGAWTLEVTKTKGVRFDYAGTLEEAY